MVRLGPTSQIRLENRSLIRLIKTRSKSSSDFEIRSVVKAFETQKN